MANIFIPTFLLFFFIHASTSSNCGKVIARGISAADKNNIVNYHNQLRGLIASGKVPGQPRGKNLLQMRWDNNLAAAAQNIANTCVFKHVKVNDKRFYVGQNLGWSASTANNAGSTWKSILNMWFNEYKNFKYPNKSNGVTGHYTQLVWAKTYLVGCGVTKYYKNGRYEKLYVCNYGPGGNYVGQAPYQI